MTKSVIQQIQALFLDGDCSIEAIEALIARNRYGRQFTEALTEYINMRVELEKTYAKGLEKLAVFEFPKLFPIMDKAMKKHGNWTAQKGRETGHNELAAAMIGVQKDLAEQATTHKTFAKKLESEIFAAFRKSFGSQIGTKMKHKTRLLDGAEEITKTTKKIAEMEKNNMKFCKRVKECEGKVQAEPLNPRVTAELDCAVNTRDQARQKEADAKRAFQSMKENFKKTCAEAAADIWKSELERLMTTVKTMTAFSKKIEQNNEASTDIALSIVRKFEDSNPEDDLDYFGENFIIPLLKASAQAAQKISSAKKKAPSYGGDYDDYGDQHFLSTL